MKVNKIKLKQVQEKTIIDMICEGCKKSMKVEHDAIFSDYTHKAEYYSIKTSHQDWGNDSIDSIEYKDLCEPCAFEFIDLYVKNMRDGFDINVEKETEYFTYEDYDLDDYEWDKYWGAVEYNEKVEVE